MSNFLNLKGWDVASVKENAHDYRVEASVTSEPPSYCPKCMKMHVTIYRHGSRKQLLHDLPSHGKRVGIHLTRPRYRCQGCKETFLQRLDEVDDGKQMTRRLCEYIEAQSLRRTFVDVADSVGVDEKTVRNLFRAYVERLDAETVFETPNEPTASGSGPSPTGSC